MTPFARLGSIAPTPYSGWVSGTAEGDDGQIATTLAPLVISAKTTAWQLGRKVGSNRRMVHLNTGPERPPTTDTAPPQLWFGGNARLQLIAAEPDGPGYHLHYRAVINPFTTCDAWIQWYPGQPWAGIEVLLTGGRIGLDQLQGQLPAPVLTTPNGVVLLRGHQGPLPCTNGQGQAWAGVVVWPQQLTGDDYQSAISFYQAPPELVIDTGAKFGPLGKPDMSQASVRAWGLEKLPEQLRAIGSWGRTSLGVDPNSGDTGQQDDEGYVGVTEPFAPDGLGALYVRYLSALTWAHRPNGYREQDGSPLALDGHPGLVLYNGRPDPRFSRDLLGLSVQPTVGFGPATDTQGGWFGWDNQHALVNGLCEAAMLSGSGLLQQLVQDQIRCFLFSQTTDPSLPTSHSDAPRAVGWTMLAAAKLHWACDDPALRDRLKARAIDRLDKVYMPELFGRPEGWFEVVVDPRIYSQFPDGMQRAAAVPWMHTIAAIGLCAAFEEFGDARFLLLAHQAAKAVIEHGWQNAPQLPGSASFIPVEAVAYPKPATGDYVAPFPPDLVGGFGEWLLGAVSALLHYRQQLQAVEPALVARAQAIMDEWGPRYPNSRWVIP